MFNVPKQLTDFYTSTDLEKPKKFLRLNNDTKSHDSINSVTSLDFLNSVGSLSSLSSLGSLGSLDSMSSLASVNFLSAVYFKVKSVFLMLLGF